MHLRTHPAGESNTPQLQSTHGQVSALLSTILQKTSSIHAKQLCSPAQHACLEDFLQGIQKQAYTKNRLLANHSRSDIGAWVSMYHLPEHTGLRDIVHSIRQQLPELLSSKERETLGHLFFVHTYIRTHNQTRYLNYIATLPLEEQSYMIQLYKQMIIGWMSHANGSSIYFPHLPTGRSSTPATPRGEDEDLLEEQFPGYKETKKRLDNSPDHVQPPRSSLQDVFHDILLISTLAQQLSTAELLDTYIQQRSNSGSGYIASHAYTGKMFFPEEKSYTEQSDETETTEDHYLTQSYNTLTHMRSLVGELLEDWAVIHEKYKSNERYEAVSEKIRLKRVRGNLQMISILNNRVDNHFFIDNEAIQKNIISSDIFNLLEINSLIFSSEKTNALTKTDLLLYTIEANTNVKFNTHIHKGLSNSASSILHLIEQGLINSLDLNLLLDYLTFLPTSSVHVTHSRILKWIQNTYTTEGNRVSLENGTVVVLPMYAGCYQANDMCSSPELRKKTLEEGRVFLHTHAIHCGIPLTKYTTSFTSTTIQQLSCTEFCYWMIDYLRVQTKKDAEISQQLYNKLMEIFTPLHTVKSFLADHYETIIGKSIDAHTGEDGVF